MASLTSCLRSQTRQGPESRAINTTKPAPKEGTIYINADVEDELKQLPPLPTTPPRPHPQFIHCMPPRTPTYCKHSVFLAGSIEMGKAVQWEACMAAFLSTLPITVNNPRRGYWDPNATQEAKNESSRYRIVWELSALEKADVICPFFDVKTKSPVSMLELVCSRYGVPFEELVSAMKDMLKERDTSLNENGDPVK